jgi:hypothetical protein
LQGNREASLGTFGFRFGADKLDLSKTRPAAVFLLYGAGTLSRRHGGTKRTTITL